VRIREGSRLERIVVARDFDSVAGMLESGRTFTSNVAFDAFSAARRTSIGPDSEARAPVSPVLRNEKRSEDRCVFLLKLTKCKPRRTVYSCQTIIRDPNIPYSVNRPSITPRCCAHGGLKKRAKIHEPIKFRKDKKYSHGSFGATGN
jgi:hypothetical protein